MTAGWTSAPIGGFVSVGDTNAPIPVAAWDAGPARTFVGQRVARSYTRRLATP